MIPMEGTTRLRSLLDEAFPGAAALEVVDRTGGGDHFHVTVVSPRFEGLSLVAQHPLVYYPLAGARPGGAPTPRSQSPSRTGPSTSFASRHEETHERPERQDPRDHRQRAGGGLHQRNP